MTATILQYATRGLNNLEFHSQPWLRVLSFTSVTTLLLLSCVPPLHVPVRNLLRPTVVYHVERGICTLFVRMGNDIPQRPQLLCAM